MRRPSEFLKKPFQQQPKETPMASKDSSGHPEVYREVLGQIERNMELQMKKIFDRIDELKRDANSRIGAIERYLEATEAKVEELSAQFNMQSAKQTAAEYNSRARDQNSLVTSKEMFLCPLRHPESNNDVRCPSTLAELETYRGSELDALLRDLGEPVPIALKHKLEIIKWALGLRNGKYK
ncbi:hypothetical protein GGI43DRAFT_395860 [Trichoderma evansii]